MIAGEGPLRSTIESRLAALGLDAQIRLLGHRPDVETVFAALDVFVLSSASEGLSNTILEAMASGRPVVATRVGGADEMVVDGVTGLLVAPHDPAALAAALARLVRDSRERCAMGAAGRARVESTFDLADAVRRYEALYQDVVGSRAS